LTSLEHKEQLLRTTEIQERVVAASNLLDSETKQALNQHAAFIRDYITDNPKTSLSQLKSLTSELLAYWNETIHSDTETFWAELTANHINFTRKDPLRFALEKNRFRKVEQGIAAKNNWAEVKKLAAVTNRFTKTEIEQIDSIIEADETQRLALLKKCLVKSTVPQTLYLKFGESMAYFERCNLFGNYFTNEQVEDLYTIWSNAIYQ